jgi:site-specific DNA-cytosine methylase
MHDVVEYGAKCPGMKVIVFESVQQAGKSGLTLMRQLRDKIEAKTGQQWELHHVFHNNLSCGGNSDRPRYFFVASRVPFGTLKTEPLVKVPRADEVLRGDGPGIDGNETPRTAEARRTASLLATGVEWNARETVSQAAGRYVEAHGIDALKKLDAWDTKRLQYFASRGFRPDQYQPRRWAANAPCPVITGKIQESVHPTEPRVLTLREGARALGYPEEWKLSAYKTDAWLGKGIPCKSGYWIANCVKASLDGKSADLLRGELIGEREWTHDNTRSWRPVVT